MVSSEIEKATGLVAPLFCFWFLGFAFAN